MSFACFLLAFATVMFGVTSSSAADDDPGRLAENIRKMKLEAAELRENGQPEKAESLEEAARDLAARIDQSLEKRARQGSLFENPDVRHLKGRLVDLREARKIAETNGEPPEVLNSLREEMRNIELKLEEITQRHRFESVPPQFREQMEKLEHGARRLQQIRVAAESLKNAELHDLAHEVMKKADAMDRDLQSAKRELSEAMQAFRQEQHQGPSVNAESVRSENEMLRRELKELRELVQKLRAENSERAEKAETKEVSPKLE